MDRPDRLDRPDPNDPATFAALEIDARARISWGHEPETVANSLRSQGVPPQRVKQVVQSALAERDEAFKRKGIRNLALAGVVAAISLYPTVVVSLERGIEDGMKMYRPACMLMTLAALVLAARGATAIVMGGKGSGPVSESDPVFDQIAKFLLGLLVLLTVVVLGILAAKGLS